MKTAAANLKEMLCTSVDLFLAQNIGMLNSESRVDNKLIQTYIEEADRDRMSIVNLIKTSEDADRFADDYTLLTTGSTLCRQIGLCERSCFQSELKISSPFYLAGNISYGRIRDIVGIVQRKNVPVLNLKLQLPILELPTYATLYNNIHRLNTIEFKQQSNSIWAVGDDSVQVSQLKTELKERTMVNIGGIQQVKLNGSVLRKLETIEEGNTRFKIIDAQIGKTHVMCDNLIKIVEWTETEPNTFKTTDSKIGNIDMACRLNNENLLVFNAAEKKFCVVDNSISKISRQFRMSPPRTNVAELTDMIVTKFIVMSMKKKILVFDLGGKLKFSYSADESDMRCICSDRNDNIFVADYKKNRICLFTSDGHFVYDFLTSVHGIRSPISITVDGSGNLWVLNERNTLSVFAYNQ